MRMNTKMVVLAALCACLIVLPAQVKADTIFSNLGPFVSGTNPGYGPGIACALTGQTSCGAEFTSLGDFAVTHVTLAVFTGFGPFLPGPLFLSLQSDVNGLPGPALVDVQVAPQGNLLGSPFQPPPLSWAFPSEPLLFAGGNYWLVLSDTGPTQVGAFVPFAFWPANSTGGLGENVFFSSSGNSPSFGTQPAFELDGTPVPEPNPFFLLGTGMAALITFFRLRRKVSQTG
jgi:hypothetical protein